MIASIRQKPFIWILALFLGLAILASLQAVAFGPKQFEPNGQVYTHYNNYIIFKKSFDHLLHNQDLYQLYPAEHWDLYKYSPSFALAFGFFRIWPDWLGLIFWNVLNALVLYWGLKRCPGLEKNAQIWALLYVVVEMVTALQSAQSNALIAGLLLWAFAALENRQYHWASLAILLTAFIKVFGVVGFALFLFYPQKWKLALYTLGWALLLALLPLVVISPPQLLSQYVNWGRLLADDHAMSYGYSVLGWLKTWFGYAYSKNAVVLVGVVLFCLPLLRLRQQAYLGYRLLMLASILIWIVIFNHKAESPTFVIAIAGVALWYFPQPLARWRWVLLLLALIFTQLSPTELFPRPIQRNFINPYVIKAVPCILIWGAIIWQLLREDFAHWNRPTVANS